MMVTIATFENPQAAHIAKGLLESEGIPCRLSNEAIASMLPIGSIELLVNEKDAGRAKKILQETED